MFRYFKNNKYNNIFNATVLIAGAGYAIDMFDFFLYNVTRISALTDLGLDSSSIIQQGVFILQIQVAGLLLGGIIWGILGDKIGRKATLISSVLIYSIASLLCAYVQDIQTYKILRFITGLGLAGEIGVGLVIVAESLKGHARGWGIALFVFFGFLGMVLAGLIGTNFDWRTSYMIGGVGGLLLLLIRSRLKESELFTKTKIATNNRGQFFRLFQEYDLFKRFTCAVFILMPNFFAIGLFLTFSPEIMKAMGAYAPIKVGFGFIIYSAFSVVGDFLGTYLSYLFQSRKKVLAIFLVLNACVLIFGLTLEAPSAFMFYIVCALMGATNLWVLVNMVSAEQFGTNIRSTAATSALNMGRSTIILITASFLFLKGHGFDVLIAVRLVAIGVMVIAAVCWFGLRETYHLDMDYLD